MVVLFSVLSIFSGTCLACNARYTAYEKQIETLSGLLLVAGLGIIGALLPLAR